MILVVMMVIMVILVGLMVEEIFIVTVTILMQVFYFSCNIDGINGMITIMIMIIKIK